LDLSRVQMPVKVKEKIQVVSGAKLLGFWPATVEVSVVPALTRHFPVEPEVEEFPPSGFAIQSIKLDPETVAVSGSEKTLNAIARVVTKLNLRAQRESRVFSVEPQATDAQGEKINSLSFSPPNLVAQIEIAPGDDIKAVAVEPTFKNNLPAGFTLREIMVEPKVVSLRGAASLLEGLNSIPTTPLDLKGRFQDFEEEAALQIPLQTSLLTSTNLVKIKVLLNSSVTTTRLKLVPRYVKLAESLTLSRSSPSLVEVVLSGDAEAIRQLDVAQVELAVDLTGVLSGTNTLKLTPEMVKTPLGIQALALEPSEVTVALQRK